MSLNHWKKFFKRILLLCFIFSISRIAFYLYNIKINEFDRLILALIEGIRFDLSALLYINLPLLFLLLIHYFSPKSKLLNRLINLLFYLINIPFIILNNIDIIFYSFNLKRSTIDFFNFITYTDLKNVYFNYLFEYWPITLLSFLQIWILIKIKQLPNLFKRKINHILLIIVGLFILIIGLRGGTQLKPIKPIHAGVLLKSGHPEVVLNTPFTILHSYNQENLKNIKYYDTINKLDFNPVHNYKNGNFNKSNVVIIILESFSKEFIGYYNSGDGYTPFLDSLMNTGLVLENAFANGVRSIEALPAITASIPSLMTEPFITTPYANNHIVSIAEILKKEGYSTSFFHGGEKGTMGFYEYCQKVGFENYYGKDQHTNKEDYDGNWGIYDQPFFQFFANKLNQTKEPFFSTFFSLTSHPPYQLPQELSEKFPKGELAIHQSIGYSDYALKKFFEEAQSMKWFDNTLFVITADHTSPLSIKTKYKNKIGRYSIPIMFWKSDQSLSGKINTISQQIDIFPTILDILNYDKDFFSFGKSIFENKNWAISFLKNEYLFINEENILINKNENYTFYQDNNLSIKTNANDSVIIKLKSIKQEFNSRMIKNKMNNVDN